jgi:hypothetical protein
VAGGDVGSFEPRAPGANEVPSHQSSAKKLPDPAAAAKSAHALTRRDILSDWRMLVTSCRTREAM